MIHSLANKIARDIWEIDFSKKLPVELHFRTKALLTIMHNTNELSDLKSLGQPPSVRLHKLKGSRKGEWNVTISLPWCITFKFQNGGFYDVRIENYHKG